MKAYSSQVFLIEENEGRREALKGLLNGYGVSASVLTDVMNFQPDNFSPDSVFLVPDDEGPFSKQNFGPLRERFPDATFIKYSREVDFEAIAFAANFGVFDYVLFPDITGRLGAAVSSLVFGVGESKFQTRDVKIYKEALFRIWPDCRKVLTDVQLTKRETEVMSLICQGVSSNEISNILGISVRTVECHRNNAVQRMGVKNLYEAISKFTRILIEKEVFII